MKTKLSFKILLLVIIVLIVFTLIPSIFILGYVDELIYKKTVQNVEDVGYLFAKVNKNSLKRMDYYSVENNLKQFSNIEGIFSLKVYDNSKFLVSKYINEENIPSKDNYKKFITKDIIDEKRNDIGNVRIGFSTRKAANEIRTIYFSLLGIIFITIILTAFSLFVSIKKIVNKPINSLLKVVNQAASGKLDIKARVDTNDEIGFLAANFNVMIAKLRESISFISNIVESMPSILISIDKKGTILEFNSSAEKYTNKKEDNVIGKNIWKILPNFKKYKSYIDRVLKHNKAIELHREPFDNGEKRYHNVSLYPLKTHKVRGVVIRIEDVTELVKKDQQLKEAQKLELVGTLASGIAHDFNNIIGSISGTLSIIKYKLNTNRPLEQNELKNYIDVMDKASNRASTVASQLLTLSSNNNLNMKSIDLNKVVEDVLQISKNSFDKSIDIKINLYDNTAIIKGDKTSLERVILNILVNAVHSMTIMRDDEDYGGIIEIILTKTKQEFWKLKISDSGVGIPKENLENVFDPFFSTKDKGSGLGLPMVKNIINQHNGKINIKSEVNKGTDVILFFPISKKDKQEVQITKENIKKGEGVILVVDDEKILRQNTKEMLEYSGYNVLTANNGMKAIDVFKKNKDKIDLVLLDLIMPKKNGYQTLKKLVKIYEDIKVIMSSGYKMDHRIKKSMKLGAKKFIQKPYSFEKLSKIIYNIIEK